MIKKYYNKITEYIEDYQKYLTYVTSGLAVGTVTTGVSTYVANKAYDNGYKNGCEVTVVSNRISAIKANVAQYVITNKITGETSFQYKTNNKCTWF